jgi:preprotein translocase subunit SecA
VRTTAFSFELQRARHILTKVNALAPMMREMSDQELQAQTPRMRKMLREANP